MKIILRRKNKATLLPPEFFRGCFKIIKDYMRGEKETLKKAKGLTDKQFNDCVNKLTGTKASFQGILFQTVNMCFQRPKIIKNFKNLDFSNVLMKE